MKQHHDVGPPGLERSRTDEVDSALGQPIDPLAVEAPHPRIRQTGLGKDLGVDPVELARGQMIQRAHLAECQPGLPILLHARNSELEVRDDLSPRWLRRKELADADLRTMLATHHYLRSIGVYANRKAGKVRVGFHPAAKARNLEGETVNILLKDMARVHEFGSAKANIPARKHWRPHLRTMKDRAPKVRAHIKQRILAKLKGVG